MLEDQADPWRRSVQSVAYVELQQKKVLHLLALLRQCEMSTDIHAVRELIDRGTEEYYTISDAFQASCDVRIAEINARALQRQKDGCISDS